MIDHLVFATPDLAATVAELSEYATLTPGGQHVGMGTRNVLLGLTNKTATAGTTGALTYLEVVGPDLDQPAPNRPRPFGIDNLSHARLVAWAVAVTDISVASAAAMELGWDVGDAQPMSRARPDGALLSWQLTMPNIGPDGLAVRPFLIDWGTTEHPGASLSDPAPSTRATTSTTATTLESFVVSGSASLERQVRTVTHDPRPEFRVGAPSLVATIKTARGLLTLRS
jgi:hypothetical protein